MALGPAISKMLPVCCPLMLAASVGAKFGNIMPASANRTALAAAAAIRLEELLQQARQADEQQQRAREFRAGAS
ncbi:hypothetical protein [Arthrobacter sp. UYEF3]|uniref:hypothetical protein n=1 Tax=Arthrobacter sp. UYEF3 TaxID=1756365 RepID=UPI0033997886